MPTGAAYLSQITRQAPEQIGRLSVLDPTYNPALAARIARGGTEPGLLSNAIDLITRPYAAATGAVGEAIGDEVSGFERAAMHVPVLGPLAIAATSPIDALRGGYRGLTGGFQGLPENRQTFYDLARGAGVRSGIEIPAGATATGLGVGAGAGIGFLAGGPVGAAIGGGLGYLFGDPVLGGSDLLTGAVTLPNELFLDPLTYVALPAGKTAKGIIAAKAAKSAKKVIKLSRGSQETVKGVRKLWATLKSKQKQNALRGLRKASQELPEGEIKRKFNAINQLFRRGKYEAAQEIIENSPNLFPENMLVSLAQGKVERIGREIDKGFRRRASEFLVYPLSNKPVKVGAIFNIGKETAKDVGQNVGLRMGLARMIKDTDPDISFKKALREAEEAVKGGDLPERYKTMAKSGRQLAEDMYRRLRTFKGNVEGKTEYMGFVREFSEDAASDATREANTAALYRQQRYLEAIRQDTIDKLTSGKNAISVEAATKQADSELEELMTRFVPYSRPIRALDKQKATGLLNSIQENQQALKNAIYDIMYTGEVAGKPRVMSGALWNEIKDRVGNPELSKLLQDNQVGKIFRDTWNTNAARGELYADGIESIMDLLTTNSQGLDFRATLERLSGAMLRAEVPKGQLPFTDPGKLTNTIANNIGLIDPKSKVKRSVPGVPVKRKSGVELVQQNSWDDDLSKLVETKLKTIAYVDQLKSKAKDIPTGYLPDLAMTLLPYYARHGVGRVTEGPARFLSKALQDSGFITARKGFFRSNISTEEAFTMFRRSLSQIGDQYPGGMRKQFIQYRNKLRSIAKSGDTNAMEKAINDYHWTTIGTLAQNSTAFTDNAIVKFSPRNEIYDSLTRSITDWVKEPGVTTDPVGNVRQMYERDLKRGILLTSEVFDEKEFRRLEPLFKSNPTRDAQIAKLKREQPAYAALVEEADLISEKIRGAEVAAARAFRQGERQVSGILQEEIQKEYQKLDAIVPRMLGYEEGVPYTFGSDAYAEYLDQTINSIRKILDKGGVSDERQAELVSKIDDLLAQRKKYTEGITAGRKGSQEFVENLVPAENVKLGNLEGKAVASVNTKTGQITVDPAAAQKLWDESGKDIKISGSKYAISIPKSTFKDINEFTEAVIRHEKAHIDIAKIPQEELLARFPGKTTVQYDFAKEYWATRDALDKMGKQVDLGAETIPNQSKFLDTVQETSAVFKDDAAKSTVIDRSMRALISLPKLGIIDAIKGKDISLPGFLRDPMRVIPGRIFEKYVRGGLKQAKGFENKGVAALQRMTNKGYDIGSAQSAAIWKALNTKGGIEKLPKKGGLRSIARDIRSFLDEAIENSGKAWDENKAFFWDGRKATVRGRELYDFQNVDPAVSYSEWVARRIGKRPTKRADYITHYRDMADIVAEMAPDGDPTVYSKYFKARTGAQSAGDVIEALDAYMPGVYRYIGNSTLVNQLELEAVKALKKGSPNRARYYQWFSNQLKGRVGWTDRKLNRIMEKYAPETLEKSKKFWGSKPASGVAKAFEKMSFLGIIGGNVGLALRNATQSLNTAAASPRTIIGGTAAMLKKDGRKLARELIDGDTIKGMIGDLDPTANKLYRKIEEYAFTPFNIAETMNRGIALYAGAFSAMKKLGIKPDFDNLVKLKNKGGKNWNTVMEEAGDLILATQFPYDMSSRSPIAKSPFGRVFLQFSNFAVKQGEFVLNDLTGMDQLIRRGRETKIAKQLGLTNPETGFSYANKIKKGYPLLYLIGLGGAFTYIMDEAGLQFENPATQWSRFPISPAGRIAGDLLAGDVKNAYGNMTSIFPGVASKKLYNHLYKHPSKRGYATKNDMILALNLYPSRSNRGKSKTTA